MTAESFSASGISHEKGLLFLGSWRGADRDTHGRDSNRSWARLRRNSPDWRLYGVLSAEILHCFHPPPGAATVRSQTRDRHRPEPPERGGRPDDPSLGGRAGGAARDRPSSGGDPLAAVGGERPAEDPFPGGGPVPGRGGDGPCSGAVLDSRVRAPGLSSAHDPRSERGGGTGMRRPPPPAGGSPPPAVERPGVAEEPPRVA